MSSDNGPNLDNMSFTKVFNRWAQKKPLAYLSMMIGTAALGACFALKAMPPLMTVPSDGSVYQIPCAQSMVTAENLQSDGVNMTAVFSQKSVEDCTVERKQQATDTLHRSEDMVNGFGKGGSVLLALGALSLYNFRRNEKKNGIDAPKP